MNQSICPICNSICQKDIHKEVIMKYGCYLCNNCQVNFNEYYLFFYIKNNSITTSPTYPYKLYVEYYLSTQFLYICDDQNVLFNKYIDVSNIKSIALKINKLSYL